MRDDAFTVYFTKNGVQYVVVTLLELAPWLIGILKTWAFTDQPPANDSRRCSSPAPISRQTAK